MSTEEIWEYLSDHKVSPQWSFITDKHEIERRLCEWHFLHYRQAKETPLASQYWHKTLDPLSKTDKEMDKIIQGHAFEESTLP